MLAALVFSWCYNLFLHPLRNYPGPRLWAVSGIPYARTFLRGHMHEKMLELHQIYGPVIRVEPNKLVYHDAGAIDHIWSRRRPQDSRPALINALNPNNILCGPPDKHMRHRRALMPGFSRQAKLAREGVIQQYAAMLVAKLHGQSASQLPINISKWIHRAQGDMVSQLTYGENLGCLHSDSESPLLAALLDWDVLTAYGVVVLSFLPTRLLTTLVSLVPSGLESGMLSELTRLSKERTVERMGSAPSDHADFVSSVWKDDGVATDDDNRKDGSLDARTPRFVPLTLDEVHSNIKIFTVGALGTMTHLLTATAFYLAINPKQQARLADELRLAFAAEEHINLEAVMDLPYLNAVIQEAMRLRPPTPMLFPREVAAGGDSILGRHIPAGVSAPILVLHEVLSDFFNNNLIIPDCRRSVVCCSLQGL